MSSKHTAAYIDMQKNNTILDHGSISDSIDKFPNMNQVDISIDPAPRTKRPSYILDSKDTHIMNQPKIPRLQVDRDDSFIGMRGANIVYEMLLKNNVEYIFGYNGGTIVPIMDIVCNSDRIKLILPRHEQGGGFIAEGYARSTGKPGIILVTSGPGSTNIITALNDALLDGVPLVAFTGQVPLTALGTAAFQEADIIGMTRACTKWNTMVKDVSELPYIINKAFTMAVHGRPGPVLINLPLDVTESEMTRSIPSSDFVPMEKMINTANLCEIKNNRSSIIKCASLIDNAKRPVIYAGQGIVYHPEGPSLLSALAHKANIPVTTTLNALGSFDEEDPKSLHMLGVHGTCYANLAIQNADLIIALGARFDERAIVSVQSFAPEAIKASKESRGGIIQFEILTNSRIKADVVVGGDVSENLKQLIPLVKYSERTEWLEMIQHWKDKYPFYYEKATNDSQWLKPQQVIEAFEEQIKNKKDRLIVTTGVGNHQLWTANIIKWRKPRSFISSGGFGTMGYGLGTAIGCKIAKPNHIVVDIDGDASFSMTAMELVTAAEYNICIKVIIINDSCQGMVKQHLDWYYEKRQAGTLMKNPDFVKLAEAMGIRAIRVTKNSELDEKMAELLAYNDGPIVMDAVTCNDEHLYPMVPRGCALDQFSPHPIIAERNSMK